MHKHPNMISIQITIHTVRDFVMICLAWYWTILLIFVGLTSRVPPGWSYVSVYVNDSTSRNLDLHWYVLYELMIFFSVWQNDTVVRVSRMMLYLATKCHFHWNQTSVLFREIYYLCAMSYGIADQILPKELYLSFPDFVCDKTLCDKEILCDTRSYLYVDGTALLGYETSTSIDIFAPVCARNQHLKINHEVLRT